MELKFILEAILFSAQKPLSPKEIRDLLGAAVEHGEEAKPFRKTKEADIVAALEQLQQDHEALARTYRLACIAGGWQFVSQPQYAPWIMALVGTKARPPRLSQPALETLAIIAYRQPIGRAEVADIRGVDAGAILKSLLERGLVDIVGRGEGLGRPLLYGTTPLFLEHFALRHLEELPRVDELAIALRREPQPL
jgi:segregation and condensation protein B